jgi:alpha-tubulin suppressor-like RCC1 family protein
VRRGYKKIYKKVCIPLKQLTSDTITAQIDSWGSFKDGKLGIETDKDQLQPVEMEFFSDKEVTLIAAGCDHSVVVTKQGDVYAWGFGQHGALGTGELLDSPLPVKLKKFQNGEIVEVQCGMDVTLVKTIAHL